MARLALPPVPSNGLVVLLMLLSGTAPFDEACWFHSLTLFPPVLSLFSRLLLSLTLSASGLP